MLPPTLGHLKCWLIGNDITSGVKNAPYTTVLMSIREFLQNHIVSFEWVWMVNDLFNIKSDQYHTKRFKSLHKICTCTTEFSHREAWPWYKVLMWIWRFFYRQVGRGYDWWLWPHSRLLNRAEPLGSVFKTSHSITNNIGAILLSAFTVL